MGCVQEGVDDHLSFAAAHTIVPLLPPPTTTLRARRPLVRLSIRVHYTLISTVDPAQVSVVLPIVAPNSERTHSRTYVRSWEGIELPSWLAPSLDARA